MFIYFVKQENVQNGDKQHISYKSLNKSLFSTAFWGFRSSWVYMVGWWRPSVCLFPKYLLNQDIFTRLQLKENLSSWFVTRILPYVLRKAELRGPWASGWIYAIYTISTMFIKITGTLWFSYLYNGTSKKIII